MKIDISKLNAVEQTPELCLLAVKKDGLNLEYVHEQTEKICMAAVSQNGLALKYVKAQTEDICLTALKTFDDGLQYVKDESLYEICKTAIGKKTQKAKPKKYKIKNSSVSFYSESISVPVGSTSQDDIYDSLSNTEMDISVDWKVGWEPAPWGDDVDCCCIVFDFNSPDTSKPGYTTLVGYIDLKKYTEYIKDSHEVNLEFEYKDAWGIVQDKIPFSIQVRVYDVDEDGNEIDDD